MLQKCIHAQALYDYTRTHTDELSFKKGDIITITQQLEGGWWEGTLKGAIGWFPSNYVTLNIMNSDDQSHPTLDKTLLAHLHDFQNEIVQHIWEGEVRQVNELVHLISSVIVNLESFSFLPFLNKIFHMGELLTQAVHMHQAIAAALDEMKQSSEPKRVGKLFLHFAPTVNAIGCDYSKIYLYVVTGLEKNVEIIMRHLSSMNVSFQLSRCKQQLSLVFDRLGRYPLLLKEMERYLENPHIDREDIQNAMNVYGEITERCAILRKFKEYDIEILLSTINGWQGVSIDKLGDPILTLRVTLTDFDQDPSGFHPLNSLVTADTSTQPSVLIIFPNCIVLLARTKQSSVHEFLMRSSLNSLSVVGSSEVETDIDLIVTPPLVDQKLTRPCRISLRCADQNARDLLLSTLTDLIRYQAMTEQSSWTPDVSQPIDLPVTQSVSVDLAADTSVSSVTSAIEVVRTTTISSSGNEQSATTVSSTTRTASHTDSRSTIPSVVISASSSVCGHASSFQTSSTDSYTPSTSIASNIRTLSHKITTAAHVRWPEKCPHTDLLVPPSSIRSIRLDGPQGIVQNTASHRVSSFLNLGSQPVGAPSLNVRSDGDHRPPRPHSPKPETSKELRRKKSDRQKSAINADEVVRSVDKLRDDERRNAEAARVLQVVEAYCASAWTHLGCRSLDFAQLKIQDPNNNSSLAGILQSSDKKTFLPQLISSAVLSESAATDAKKPSSFNSNTSSNTFMSNSTVVRNTNQQITSTEWSLNPPMDTPTPHYTASHFNHLSVVQQMSPPPVILPTRSGRRL